MNVAIDRARLVDWASRAIGTPSFTGDEQAMAELVRDTFAEMGLRVQWQQVEDGRANVLGIREGAGGGPSLMFNGHMDTSYSGREPWLAGVPGFQPSAFVEDGNLYGLGISNMKGALACYVEALRALADAGVTLRGDCMIAAVCGEIEKTQYGDAQGPEYRGYAAGSRYLVSHGGVADMCILGEPTEGKVVLGHFGSLWLRIGTQGNFIHTAFSEGKRDLNSIVRMREVMDAVLEWIPSWEADPENAYRGVAAIVNVGAIAGGFGWRVSRTPHRTDLFLDIRVPPTKPMAVARGQVMDMVRGLQARFPQFGVDGEIYVTAPGAEIAEDHPLVAAIDATHAEVFGSRARARRHALVLGCVRADALRGRDRQLRHIDRADGHRARREPVDRRARADRRGLRARGDAHLWSREGTYVKLVTFEHADTGVAVGHVDGDEIAVLAVPTMVEWFERGGADETGVRVPFAEARLRAPIKPTKFFHTAGNFREHEEESKQVGWSHEIAPWIGFFQNVDAIIGPDDPVIYPEHLTEELDYELELAVILRKPGKWFAPEDANDYIGGYVIFNDITARDIQRREMRSGVFSFCKAIDTFCPLGPWIVTPDEIADPHDLAMELRVNGAPRQESHSSRMSVSIPEILSHYSPLTYSAGDVLSTGTVSGVAGFSPDAASLYLKPGDVMECEIEGVGVLRNPVISWQEGHGEPAPPRVRW